MTQAQNDMSRLDEDYTLPTKKAGSYFKPSETKTKIRIMSKPITGWIERHEKTPVRTKEKPSKNYDDNKPAKHFWAMVVWNYAREQFEIWEITQASIKVYLTNEPN